MSLRTNVKPFKTRSFPGGGVHPHGYKELTNGVGIRNAPIPSISIIPMSQHIGAPCKPCVAKGDTVAKGQIVGEATGFKQLNFIQGFNPAILSWHRIYSKLIRGRFTIFLS